jgi:cyclopropane fatty-acyl-phospholipid synthase-like methyltransferase
MTATAGLVDHACQLAGIGSGNPVLEIGCGTSQDRPSLNHPAD